MPYYRKKPRLVEARQFTGDNIQELQYWGNDFVALADYNEDTICVHTLEGPIWGEKGDYIVKGVRGEFYICQKDIFEETYELSDKRDTAIRPTPVKTLNPGDLFRDGGQTFQIADIEQTDDVVKIVYYTGTSSFINSFFLSPDDTLDKVINKRVDPTDKGTLVLKKDGVKALADEFLNINRALNAIIRISADNGVDPFQVAAGEVEIECEEVD